MFWKNIIITWRNLLKNKTVSFINIFGLSLGLASSLLAILYAYHELTYEDCHSNSGRIASVYLSGESGQSGGIQQIEQTYGPEGEALKNMFPEIEAFTISRESEGIVRVGEHLFDEDRILMADEAFTEVFTVPILTGTRSNSPKTVIVSQKVAEKYFGKGAIPVGKMININLYGQKNDFEITGLYKDLPSNTHVKADIIIPFGITDQFSFIKPEEYDATAFRNYLLLRPGTDFEALNNKIVTTFKIPDNSQKALDLNAFIIPLKKTHFSGSYDNNFGKLLVFLIGGLFVLIVSGFNYINLTNILFSTRAKEIGIRKTNGGSRSNIFGLFFSDSIITTFIAFFSALTIIYLILPWFNSIMDTHITLNSRPTLALTIIGLYLFTVILCGLYPAIKFSGAKPTNLINLDKLGNGSKNYSRTILTAAQFFLAVLFIQVLMVINYQFRYMRDNDTKGYSSENVLCINGYQWGDLNKVKAELLRNTDIEAVSWGDNIPSYHYILTNNWLEEDNKIYATEYFVEEDYPKVYDLSMQEGRFFSKQYTADSKNSIVVNQIAVDVMNLTDPVGEKIFVEGEYYTIIGIIDQFMALPPVFSNMPLLMRACQNQESFLVIRINPERIKEARQYIQDVLTKINPDYPVNLKFHDDILWNSEVAKTYTSANTLMNLFFTLTIITSVIGLFGLSIYITQRRIKEVGIRKVCGASTFEILFTLSIKIILEMFAMAVIATIISVFIAKQFLSIFAIKFDPGIAFYSGGALFAILILIFSISWQTLRVAGKKPVESLRYE